MTQKPQNKTYLMNLPNFISLARLVSVPLIIWFVLQGYYWLALISFVAAGLSDALDGILARLMRSRTTLGAYLDPIADKALLVSMYITLGYQSIIPMWVVIAVVFRDILIIGGTFLLFMLGKPFSVKPITISKINTFIQVIVIIYVLGLLGFERQDAVLLHVTPWLFYLVGISTIISGGAYVYIWLQHINGDS